MPVVAEAAKPPEHRLGIPGGAGCRRAAEARAVAADPADRAEQPRDDLVQVTGNARGDAPSFDVTYLDARTGAFVKGISGPKYGFGGDSSWSAIASDGRRVWVANSDSVTELNARTAALVIVGARFPARLEADSCWGETLVALPDTTTRWRDLLTGRIVTGDVQDLLGDLPVAVLVPA